MTRPKLLDLFCGAGGAAVGYHRAGFDVVGVDVRPQPRYPFEFIQADAMTFPLEGFDAIHASPPCQGYSTAVSSEGSKWAGTAGKGEPRLIADMRDRLGGLSVPWVMENVMGARHDLRGSLLLCGTMFGLPIPRHRIFEMRDLAMSPYHPRCQGVAKRYAEARGWDPRDMTVTGKGRRAGTSQRWAQITGIDWMTQHEMREAIPPCFTEYIGRWLLMTVAADAENCGATPTGCTTQIVIARETSSSVLSARNGPSKTEDGVLIAAKSRWGTPDDNC